MIAEPILKFFADTIFNITGILYSPDDYYKLEGRIKEISKKLDIKTIEELYAQFAKELSPNMKEALVNVVSSSETYFFRDVKPFKITLNTLLPELLKNYPEDELKIWSCAGSSGQEGYSLIMGIKNVIEPSLKHGYKLDISDISSNLTERSKKGIYNSFEIQKGLGAPLLVKYFEQIDAESWQINKTLIEKCNFFQFNLLLDKYPTDKYHIIFCRNLLAPQGVGNKNKIVNELYNSLREFGVLFLGLEENLDGINHNFKVVKHDDYVYYQKLEDRKLAKNIIKFFSETIFNLTGVLFTPADNAKLEKLLTGLAKKLSIESIEDLYTLYSEQMTLAMKEALILSAVDSETHFFRDVKPFTLLVKTILPKLIKQYPSEKISIWSCATSSGQEAYSIVMSIKNVYEPSLKNGYVIDASDLSNMSLEKAKAGLYDTFEIQKGLPAPMIVKYFQQDNSESWQINQDLKDKCHFFQLNLLSRFNYADKYHVIYCRNMLSSQLIDNRASIIANLHMSLKDNGILILGVDEKYDELSSKFNLIEQDGYCYYEKK